MAGFTKLLSLTSGKTEILLKPIYFTIDRFYSSVVARLTAALPLNKACER
jgi:hypothetical protein